MPSSNQSLTTYKSLSVTDLVTALSEERLQLPPYQRRGVWGKDKQKALMVSLQRQWPVGSLLFARLDGGSREQFTLIDGQQRATAIRKFHDNPCAFLSPDDVSSSVLRALCDYVQERLNGDIEREVRRAVQQWLANCISMTPDGRFTAATLQQQLEAALSLTGHSSLTAKCEAVLNNLKTNWTLGDRHIALTLYGGPTKDIPEIFDLINTAGASLDKFDIYAAQWFQENTDTVIRNDDIDGYIVASYEKQLRDGMTFESPFEDREPMLVEYLFGFGKLLVSKYGLFFGKLSPPHEIEEVVFNIAATAHKLKITQDEMARLNTRMRERHQNAEGKIDPTDFENALLKACKFTKDVLGSLLQIRLNKSSNEDLPEILHNTSQIVSMICRVLVGQYESDFVTERPAWQSERVILQETLRHYYLEDILTDKWKGAAAGTLWDRVWQQQEDGSYVPSSHYLKRRDEDHWNRLLYNYNTDLKAALKTGGRYVQKHHKVLLKYAVHKTLLLSQQDITFEIEHLFPVSRLQDLIRRNGDQATGWPIDHVANLAIFSRTLNREKSKKTLLEYWESITARERSRLGDEGLNMLMCEVQDVAIPATGRFRKSHYEEFLDMRFKVMVESVKRYLFRD